MIHWPRSEFPAVMRSTAEREVIATLPNHSREGLPASAQPGFTGAGVGPLSNPVAGANR